MVYQFLTRYQPFIWYLVGMCADKLEGSRGQLVEVLLREFTTAGKVPAIRHEDTNNNLQLAFFNDSHGVRVARFGKGLQPLDELRDGKGRFTFAPGPSLVTSKGSILLDSSQPTGT